jgi:hypothetical protein
MPHFIFPLDSFNRYALLYQGKDRDQDSQVYRKAISFISVLFFSE